MAVMPGAVWRGNCRNNSGLRTAVTRGIVIHVNDGPDIDLWGWVNNPDSQMSCHFQIVQNGTIYQYLDTDLWSWCQAGGNNAWLSAEFSTRPNVPMTPEQLAAGGRLIAWAAEVERFPLQLTSDINGKGIGWHGMGVPAWGTHPGCPGDIRRGQLPVLLQTAISGKTPQKEDDMPYREWPQADKDALTADLTRAFITRSLAGHTGYAKTVGEALSDIAHNSDAASRDARNASVALNDPGKGLVVKMALLNASLAKLPGEVEAALTEAVATLPAGGTLDVNAVVSGVVAGVLERLHEATAPGAHSADLS